MNISFTGKRVLVTGGASGIGKAIVKKMYDSGAKVFVIDKSEEAIAELTKELPNVKAECVDLTDFGKIRQIVESFGPLDHLVNNAGVIATQHFLDMDLNSVDRLLDVNFKSYIVVGQTVAKGMIGNRINGSIVNIASVGGQKPVAGLGAYCCSKAAVTMLTKIMAVELGPSNIRVNSVSPAHVDTNMLARQSKTVEEQAKVNARSITGNIIQRAILRTEVAELVLFLLSSNSAMITGENIFIDGGNFIK